jgi:hypothetical protein
MYKSRLSPIRLMRITIARSNRAISLIRVQNRSAVSWEGDLAVVDARAEYWKQLEKWIAMTGPWGKLLQ